MVNRIKRYFLELQRNRHVKYVLYWKLKSLQHRVDLVCIYLKLGLCTAT